MNRSLLVLSMILILALQLFMRIPFLAEPMEGDEGAYAYIAQGLLRGEVPYRDTFDHKPPGIYFIYAATFKLFGDSLSALRHFTAFYALLTTLAIFFTAGLFLGSCGGLIASLLYAIFSNGPFLEGTSANSEVFMVLPMVLALLAFCYAGRKQNWVLYFLAGLLSGTALMIKQVAFFNFVVLFGLVLVDREAKPKIKNLFWLSLGALVFPVIFMAYFYFQGALQEFYRDAFYVNLFYIKPFKGFVNTRWGQLNAFRIAALFLELSALMILSFAASIHVLLKDRKREPALLLLWGSFSLLGALIGRYAFGHYFIQVLPAFAILGGYALIKWRKKTLPFGWNLLAASPLLILSLLIIFHSYKFFVVYSPDEISFARYHIDNLRLSREAARIIEQRTKPTDYIYVWGTDPQIYFYTKKRSPAKFIYLPFHFPGLFKKAMREAEEFIGAGVPKYVIITRPIYGALEEIIDKNYHLLLRKNGIFHGQLNHWGIFERNI